MKNCLCLAFTWARAVSMGKRMLKPLLSVLLFFPFFILSSPQVLCKLEAERRQELILSYFFTAPQRGNFVLKLYYLWKMVAYGARDNCFSKRLIHHELAGAGSWVSLQLWEAVRNQQQFVDGSSWEVCLPGRMIWDAETALVLATFAETNPAFQIPFENEQTGSKPWLQKFCVPLSPSFHLSVYWRNKPGISQFHYIEWNIIEIQTFNNLQGLKKSPIASLQ